MAVFQGARLRGAAFPPPKAARPRAAVSLPPRPRSESRAAAGVRPTGILIAAILVATMVALAYLTQTVGSNATTAEIDRLTAKSNELRALIAAQTYNVELGTDAESVAGQARQMGLKPLSEPIILRVP